MPFRPSPGLAAEVACILEASARKAGNVTPFQGFEDAGYLDFVLAACALGRAIDRTIAEGVGRTVLESVEAARSLAGHNANLGLVLLIAPLARAAWAATGAVGREDAVRVLRALTPDDGAKVYQAIRLAEPGGLGSAREEDVRAGPPARPLVEAMALASERDLIARQYSGGFQEVFEDALPFLAAELAAAGTNQTASMEAAIVRLHLYLMARYPDSLIRRKAGEETAREAARRAGEVLALGWPAGKSSGRAFDELDRWLRADGHRRNPGATADLVGASLFLAIYNGIIPLPLGAKTSSWSDIESA